MNAAHKLTDDQHLELVKRRDVNERKAMLFGWNWKNFGEPLDAETIADIKEGISVFEKQYRRRFNASERVQFKIGFMEYRNGEPIPKATREFATQGWQWAREVKERFNMPDPVTDVEPAEFPMQDDLELPWGM